MSDQNIAFDIEDPDFAEFLPKLRQELSEMHWTDFNIPDSGVTTLEAILYSVQNQGYSYDFPIVDLMQGKFKSAFSSWTTDLYFSESAVTEDDYRRVLAEIDGIRNSILLPDGNDKNPELYRSLYDVYVALDAHTHRASNHIFGEGEKRLIANRALCEYFRFQPDHQGYFIEERCETIDCEATIVFKRFQDTKENKAIIHEKLAEFLLPTLGQSRVNWPDPKRDLLLDTILTGPKPDENLPPVDKKIIDLPCFRKDIIVTNLYDALEGLDFIENIDSIGARLPHQQEYQYWILKLDRQTFTRLGELKINGSESVLPAREHTRTDRPPTHINGDDHNLSEFNSLQLSFPPNYELAENLSDNHKAKKSTAPFRKFLLFFDQIRANGAKQLGALPDILSITSELPDVLEARDLATDEFYEDVINHSLQQVDKELLSHETQNKRLDFLLALNGEDSVNPLVETEPEQTFELKNEFLNLVHYNKIPEFDQERDQLFSSTALTLLQQKIEILLKFTGIERVRILEHFLLGHVWQNEEINFSISVFLFHEQLNEKLNKKSVQHLIRERVPAHVNLTIHYREIEEFETYKNLINTAYPPKATYNVDGQITEHQRNAMQELHTFWVSGCYESKPTIDSLWEEVQRLRLQLDEKNDDQS